MGNASTGINTGFYNCLDHCASSENGGFGFVLGWENQITDSIACNNKASGIYLATQGTLVNGCNCSGNTSSGIYINNFRCMVLNNLVNNNNNSSSSFQAGIYIGSSSSRVEGNYMTGNGGSGSGHRLRPVRQCHRPQHRRQHRQLHSPNRQRRRPHCHRHQLHQSLGQHLQLMPLSISPEHPFFYILILFLTLRSHLQSLQQFLALKLHRRRSRGCRDRNK